MSEMWMHVVSYTLSMYFLLDQYPRPKISFCSDRLRICVKFGENYTVDLAIMGVSKTVPESRISKFV